MSSINRSRIKFYLSLAISFSLIIYVIYNAGFDQLLSHIKQAEMGFIALSLLLSLIGVIIRYFSWQFMLKSLGYSLSFSRAVEHYSISGLLNLILPSRLGNFLRVWVAKQENEIGYDDGLAAVLLEGILALSSLTALTLLGSFTLSYKNLVMPLIISGILLTAIATVIRVKKVFDVLIKVLNPLRSNKILKKAIDNAESVLKSLRAIPRLKIFLLVLSSHLMLTSVYWTTLHSLGARANYFLLLFAFSASMLVGFLSQLPGGLGAFEGSMGLILTQFGVAAPQAVATALLGSIFIRLPNLGLGSVSLVVFARKLGEDFQLPQWSNS